MSNRTLPQPISIKPREGLQVRKPNGQRLNPAGEAVTWSSYWHRRERDGDIERVTAPAKPARRSSSAVRCTTTPSE